MTRSEGPELKYHYNTTYKEVLKSLRDTWQHCVESDIDLPTSRVRVYDESGDVIRVQDYNPFEEGTFIRNRFTQIILRNFCTTMFC